MLRRLIAAALLAATLSGCASALAAEAPVSPTAPAPTAAPAQADPAAAAQAPAMGPAFVGHLDQAAAWDRYTISVRLDQTRLTATGGLALELTNRTSGAYDAVYFHLYPNHPDFGGRLDVTGARVDGVPVGSRVANRDTLLRLELPKPIPAGGRARIELDFQARTPRDASAKTFGASNYEAGVWAMANFYPILARQIPGWGWDTRPIDSRGDFTVSDVALYDVQVEAPVGWPLVATGARVSQEELPGGVRRQRFVSGPQREFFLAALRGLDQASRVVDGVRVVSYYQPRSAAGGQRALDAAARSLAAFNERYGPYPLAEIEVVQAALTQFLGMEYPGVVLIEQNLYRDGRRGLETTVIHEVAHQWWYSQVGNDAQSEPWLDEGLASYSQVVYYQAIGDQARAAAELENFRNLYRGARERGRDAPLGSPPGALRGNVVAIVYAKGALFFEALRRQIGDEAFFAFLQRYYAEQRYGDAVGPELLAAAEAACTCELDPLYRDWVLTAAPVPIP